MLYLFFFFSSRRRHTRCALVTGVQTCALPILWSCRGVWMRVNGQWAAEVAQVDCSLGLVLHIMGHTGDAFLVYNEAYQIYKRVQGKQSVAAKQARSLKIGRASWRERVCQYV